MAMDEECDERDKMHTSLLESEFEHEGEENEIPPTTEAADGTTTKSIIHDADDSALEGSVEKLENGDEVYATLYCVHLSLILALCVVLGPRGWSGSFATAWGVRCDCTGLVRLVNLVAWFSCIISTVALYWLMNHHVANIMILCASGSVLIFAIMSVAAFHGEMLGICFLYMAIAVWIAWRVSVTPWNCLSDLCLSCSKESFAKIMRKITVMVGAVLIISCFYAFIWSMGAMGLCYKVLRCDTERMECQGTMSSSLTLALTFMLPFWIWSQQVIQNSVNVVISAHVAHFWSMPCNRENTDAVDRDDKHRGRSMWQAAASSFGVACKAALCLGPARFVFCVFGTKPGPSAANAASTSLLCAHHLRRKTGATNTWCLYQSTHSSWVLALIGINLSTHGYNMKLQSQSRDLSTFCQFMSVQMQRLSSKSQSLLQTSASCIQGTSTALLLVSMLIASVSGVVGLYIAMVDHSWRQAMFGNGGHAAVVGFLLSFVVGFSMSSICMTVFAAAANAVILFYLTVCLQAENENNTKKAGDTIDFCLAEETLSKKVEACIELAC